VNYFVQYAQLRWCGVWLLKHPGASLVSAVEPLYLLALLLDEVLDRPRRPVADREAVGVGRARRLGKPLKVVGCMWSEQS